jgi:protein-tyrosine-phosphatase
MPENLLEPEEPTVPTAPAGKIAVKPADVPEKFWDADKGELRIDVLLKSYRELERRLSRALPSPEGDDDEEARTKLLRALGWPETPDAYVVEPKHALTGPDPEINAALHKAGFTGRQVQLVYDLAAERLLPLIADAAAEFEADRERQRLAEHFGGAERFAEVARQIGAWGRAHLAPPVFEALAATFDGIVAMQRMMEKGEPKLAPRGDAAAPAADEAELRRMMRDPRYWQKREPDFVNRVTEGFRRLFPGS